MINQRLSNLSCNEEEFYNAKGAYKTALKNGGYNQELKFEPKKNQKRKRNRKVI